MNKFKPTLAIYGIQDRQDYEYPFYVHDHNMALMNDGSVECFLQLERITRHKRDNRLHVLLKDVLKSKKLLNKDYDLIFVDNVVGRTFLTQQGDARFEAPLVSKLATFPEKGRCWWFGEERNAWAVNHELAHIFTCLPFFGEFKENSLLVHFDGGASLSNFSAALYKNRTFTWIDYNWDLRPLSGIFNANALAFSIIGSKLPEQNSLPGKLMGFAGYGKKDERLKNWLIDNDLFHDIWGNTSLFFRRVYDEFGIVLKSFDQRNEFIQNVAATLQEIFIEGLLDKLQELASVTNAENLYYTGGSALNIVANTRILESGIFNELFIPPCTEDSGLALGAAALVEWIKHGDIKRHGAYLNNFNIEDYKVSYSNETLEKVARMLIDKKVIGLCNGFGEAGPRALGNRSIIALANSKRLSEKVSMKYKGREWFRPVAPVALEKNIKYFTGRSNIPSLAKYMLLDFKVQPQYINEIQGAVHVDGTARFQSIYNKQDNPFLYDLLCLINDQYNIKALINTSFNQKNEPIVHTREDAFNAAKNMGLDAVVVNGELFLM